MGRLKTPSNSLPPAPWIVFIDSDPHLPNLLASFFALGLSQYLGNLTPLWTSVGNSVADQPRGVLSRRLSREAEIIAQEVSMIGWTGTDAIVDEWRGYAATCGRTLVTVVIEEQTRFPGHHCKLEITLNYETNLSKHHLKLVTHGNYHEEPGVIINFINKTLKPIETAYFLSPEELSNYQRWISRTQVGHVPHHEYCSLREIHSQYEAGMEMFYYSVGMLVTKPQIITIAVGSIKNPATDTINDFQGQFPGTYIVYTVADRSAITHWYLPYINAYISLQEFRRLLNKNVGDLEYVRYEPRARTHHPTIKQLVDTRINEIAKAALDVAKRVDMLAKAVEKAERKMLKKETFWWQFHQRAERATMFSGKRQFNETTKMVMTLPKVTVPGNPTNLRGIVTAPNQWDL